MTKPGKETGVSGRNMGDGMTPPGDDEPLAPDDIRDEERAEDEPSADSALAKKLGAMNKLLDRLSKRIQKVKKKASTEKDDNTDRLEEKSLEMKH